MCFLHCFNKCTLYAQSQTASVSAKTCGLNFHRVGLPQYSSVHIRDHRESDLLTAVQKCFLFWAQPHPLRSCCPSSVLATAMYPFTATCSHRYGNTNKLHCFILYCFTEQSHMCHIAIVLSQVAQNQIQWGICIYRKF